MSRLESVSSPPTPGAGRKYSYTWPVLGRTVNLTVPTGGSTVARAYGAPDVQFWAGQTIGAPPAPLGAMIYKGRSAWKFTGDATTGLQFSPSTAGTNRPLFICFQSQKGTANLAGSDDFACWSISAILAFDAPPGTVTGELGLVLGSGNNSAPRNTFHQGAMEIGPVDANNIGVFIRQTDGGAVTFQQNTPLQPDMTIWHKYEIRLIGATPNAEAQVKFLIDGQLQFMLPYGAGTVLPPQINSANQLGMVPTITVRNPVAAGSCGLYVANLGLSVIAAPTENALL